MKKIILLLVILIFLLGCTETELIYLDDVETKTIQGEFDFDDDEEIVEEISYKKSNLATKDGVEYCIFIFPEKYKVYAEENKFLFENICDKWEAFDHISNLFYDYYIIEIDEGVDWEWAAYYSGDGEIYLNKKYWTSKLLDSTLAEKVYVTPDLPVGNYVWQMELQSNGFLVEERQFAVKVID